MALSLEDLQKPLEEVRQQRRDQRLLQVKQMEAVAAAAAELMQDPRWATLQGHAIAIKNRYESTASGQRGRLTNGEFLDPKQYGQLRLGLAKNEGVCIGIQIVLDLAKTLVDAGEAAAKNLVDT